MDKVVLFFMGLAFVSGCTDNSTPYRFTDAGRTASDSGTSDSGTPKDAKVVAPKEDADTTTPTTWFDMSGEERENYMKNVVVPAMRPSLGRQLTCESCHGRNAEDVGYRMPNGLAPLRQSTIDSAPTSSNRTVVRMRDQVIPKMNELLGIKAPDTMTCDSCHGVR